MTSDQERRNRWTKLLSDKRLGDDQSNSDPTQGRSEFDRDYDRVMFSSAFRRLQDKTQVFPLSPSDYTRTRLTHSLEVSCVGRSLGQMAGQILLRHNLIDQAQITPADIGMIVAAACLAHDTGNPPFGHSGEAAIQEWSAKNFDRFDLSDREKQDFFKFEGNAQSFRIFTKLQAVSDAEECG